ncbi:MAG: tetratricopeptide repeat protein, partial [Gemmatimonadota bacterium]
PPGAVPPGSPGAVAPDPRAGVAAGSSAAVVAGSAAGSRDASRPRHRVLTWRNALLGGAGAFALLGIATAGYMAMRTLGIGPAATLVAKGVIDERAPILVADFEGADEELANAATDAFRIDLGQSRVVSVVEPTEIAEVLRRMSREPDAPLDLELAREVAVREGIPVVVAGDVRRAGDAYVVSARLVQPEAGDVLVSDRRTAAGETGVLEAIDALSKRLRERIGESLRDLNREEPLERVTTPSLAALQKYSIALRAYDLTGDEDRAIALLEEAVALDSGFAMAWRKLGTILSNRAVDRARSVEALTHAFEHRDRLTQRERYQVEGIYHFQLGLDVPRAITSYENLLELDPADPYALNNLGVLYGYLRDHERAQAFYERAIAADSTSSLSYTNAAQERFARGDAAGARRMLDLFGARFPANPNAPEFQALLASAQRRYEEAERHARELLESQAASPFWTGVARSYLAAYAAIGGRVAEARRLLEENLTESEAAGRGVVFLLTAVDLAGIQARTVGDEAALETLDAALERVPLDGIPPANRPYPRLATVYAWAGRPERARALLDEMDEVVEPRIRSRQAHVQYDAAQAYVATLEGRYSEAIDFARRADRGFCTVCGVQSLAQAYDAAGEADSAIVMYERYVETPWIYRSVALDQFVLAPIHERLGQLYEARGDLESAAKHYAAFVELWAEADEALQPRVRAAQERLQEIVERRG